MRVLNVQNQIKRMKCSTKYGMVSSESRALSLMFYTIAIPVNIFLPMLGNFIHYTSPKFCPDLWHPSSPVEKCLFSKNLFNKLEISQSHWLRSRLYTGICENFEFQCCQHRLCQSHCMGSLVVMRKHNSYTSSSFPTIFDVCIQLHESVNVLSGCYCCAF